MTNFTMPFEGVAHEMRERIAELEAERDALLRDWNALIAASGSPTSGGLVGYVAKMRRQLESMAAAGEEAK